MAKIYRTDGIVDSSMNLDGIVFDLSKSELSSKIIYEIPKSKIILTNDTLYDSNADAVTPTETNVDERGDVQNYYEITSYNTYYIGTDTTKVLILVDSNSIYTFGGTSSQRLNDIVDFKQFLFHKNSLKDKRIRFASNYIVSECDISMFTGYTNIDRFRLAFNKKLTGDINSFIDTVSVIENINLQGTKAYGEAYTLLEAGKAAGKTTTLKIYAANSKITYLGNPFSVLTATYDSGGSGNYTVVVS